MAKKKKATGGEAGDQPTVQFEASLMELQQIVNTLEDGAIGLEESLEQFEKGVSLLRACYGVLNDAEQKIRILTGVDADGNAVTVDFDSSATAVENSTSAGKRKTAKKQISAEEDQADGKSSLF